MEKAAICVRNCLGCPGRGARHAAGLGGGGRNSEDERLKRLVAAGLFCAGKVAVTREQHIVVLGLGLVGYW